MLNLSSAGHMAHKGWEIHIKGNSNQCELIFNNELLGYIPMMNYLCYLNISFEQCHISNTVALASEFSFFASAGLLLEVVQSP
jgi:hypothetical protein